jgi:hypothetical protein
MGDVTLDYTGPIGSGMAANPCPLQTLLALAGSIAATAARSSPSVSAPSSNGAIPLFINGSTLEWLYASHLLRSSIEEISSHQLCRMLGVTYKTAWFTSNGVSEGMKPTGADAGHIGGE